MLCKVRSTIIRRHQAARDFQNEHELSDDSSDASSYISYTDEYFSQKEHPIAPIFQFTLASSLKNRRDLFQLLLLSPNDNVIRFDSGYHTQNLARTLELINGKIAVRNRKYIQHLAINFTDCPLGTSQRLRSIITDITKSFPAVRFLSLSFEKSCFSDRFTDKDLVWLSSHITTYMPNLKHLFIKLFEDLHFSLDGFKVFCRQIGKRLKRLESFVLDFNECEKVPDGFLKPLTRFATSYLRHLKHFKIISSGVSDLGMKEMRFNKTRYLKQLESLDLCLDARTIPQSCLSAQELVLSKRKLNADLRQLSLHFAPFHNNETRKGLEYLSSCCLQYLESLKALSLHLENIEVNLGGAQTFIEAVNARMGTLEQLKFSSQNCWGTVEEFLASFECPENNQLKKLEMYFVDEEEQEEEDEYIFFPQLLSSFISKAMPNLKNLIYLDLLFERVRIKDDQIKDLASCLTQSLEKLEFINIKFFLYFSQKPFIDISIRCRAITEASVKALHEDFCSDNALLNLKALFLTFSSCGTGITQEQIDTLKGSLKEKKPNVESMVYFIDNNTDSSYELLPGDEICRDCLLVFPPCEMHLEKFSSSSDVDLTDFLEDEEDEGEGDDQE